MNYTFTKHEYKVFIDALHHESGYEENFKYIEEIYDSCIYWEKKISGINHLLSVVLEQFAKKGVDTHAIIEFIYSLPQMSNFEIQESSEHFLDSLFDFLINPNLNLDEQLIIVQNKIS